MKRNQGHMETLLIMGIATVCMSCFLMVLIRPLIIHLGWAKPELDLMPLWKQSCIVIGTSLMITIASVILVMFTIFAIFFTLNQYKIFMAMRIGKCNGQTVKRIRRVNKDTLLVQPVRTEEGKLVNVDLPYEVPEKKFIKGRI